jgi:methionyl-tRNA formyltransferase
MRVVFLGNHTVGVRALRAIGESAEVAAVVAHPPDPEDGSRYESVSDFADANSWNLIRGNGKSPEVHRFIKEAQPDLLWITDFRYLISRELIALARLGAVNLHPSLLPAYRGRASINWAILKGERRLGLTAHFVDEGMDTGDIIDQVSYEVCDAQDVGDCLNILYPLYDDITRKVLAYFKSDRVPRVPQDHSSATSFPRRRPEDGLIDWAQTARSILNLVRAVASPYPGAFTTFSGKKATVWKARIASDTDSTAAPGRVIENHELGPVVQCGQGTLLLTSFETSPLNAVLGAGCQLGV